MYYDDESRRFNFLSGLIFGSVLGAGLALLAAPQKRVRLPGRKRRSSRLRKQISGDGLEQLKKVGGSLLESLVEAGRSRLER